VQGTTNTFVGPNSAVGQAVGNVGKTVGQVGQAVQGLGGN
jgi:hypothetical protein